MSRIDELIADHCPAGVPFKALGDVGKFIRGSGLQKADLTAEGFPAIHYGQIHTYYGTSTSSTKSFTDPTFAAKLRRAEPGDLIIATTSEDDAAVGKATAWIGANEVAVSGDAYIFKHEMDPRFVSYFFQSRPFQDQKQRHISGTKVRRISGDALAKIKIPVPQLEVQREIVRILDTFTELEAELETELEARRRQYEHYQRDLLAFPEGVPRSTLGAICEEVSSGGTPLSTRADFYGGDIPWLRTAEVNYSDIHNTAIHITAAGLEGSAARWVRPNSVIVAISGAGVTRGRVAVNKIPLTTNQHCCNLQIDPTKANYRFVRAWLAHRYEDLRSFGQGNRSDLNVGIIKGYPIALPPLAEQARIADVLDTFDALVNDDSIGLPAELAARGKQYEHYRDRLLTFEELGA